MRLLIVLHILTVFSFTQTRVSFELDGRFNNEIVSPGLTVGYDYMRWGDYNVRAGIGSEFMLKHISFNSVPHHMQFHSLYFIFKYGFEEEWGAYSKIGMGLAFDDADFFQSDNGLHFGFGVFRNFDELYNVEFGYSSNYLDEYNYSRFVFSFSRSIVDKDE